MRNILLILTFFAALLFSREASAQTVILKTDTVEIGCASSDTFLVPIRVMNFTNIGAFQFTLMWDTAKLDYIHTTPLNPAFLGAGVDVGFDTTNFLNQGKITFVWTKTTGGSVPDSSIVFSLVFTRIKGPFASVMFTDSPAVIEVAAANGDPLPFMLMPGGVKPIDDKMPTITCPANVTVQGSGPTPVNGIAPDSIADNCAPVASVGWSSVGATTVNAPNDPDASGAPFNIGVSTVTYKATDVGGNTATCSFTVTVELSNTSDTLTIIAQNTVISCGQTASVDITALNFDSLGSLQFSLGWNTSALQFTSVSNFNPALSLILGNNFNIGQAGSGLLAFLWTADDPAAGVTLPPNAVLFSINFAVSGTNSAITFGDVPVPREAVSVAGGMSNEVPAIWVNGSVTVSDNVPPTIDCPDNVAVDLPNGSSNVQVNDLEPDALLDNCPGNIGLTYVRTGATPGSGSGNANGLYNPGATTVTYTATDASGNTSACSFTVTVNAAGAFTLLIDTVSADCQGGGTKVQVNIFVENWNDIAGMQFSIDWDETVLGFDTVNNFNPGLNLTTGDFGFSQTNNGVLFFAAGGFGSNWPQLPDGSVIFTIIFDVLNPAATTSIAYSGIIEVIDNAINTVPTVTVNGFFSADADNTPPIADCPMDITVDATPNECNANVNIPLPQVSDACSGIDTITRIPSSNVFNVGITLVTFTITDSAGNSTICSMTVTVMENIPPQFFNCPTNGIEGFAPGFSCTAQVNWQPPIATDACGQTNLTITSNYTPDSTFDVGQTLVLYMVTDASGNTALCSFLVTIQDSAAPIIICPGYIVVTPDGSPNCGAVVPFALPIAFDNCDLDLDISGDADPNDTFPAGTTIVTYEAADDFNNISTCTFTVTVVDDEGPVLNCPANIIQPSDSNACGALVTWPTVTATDACDGTLTATSPFQPGQFFPVGDTIVVYTAIDASGNESTCSFQVAVTEDVPPLILGCPNNVLITLPPGECDTVVFWDTPFASDNCGLESFTGTAVPGISFPAGTTIVTYTATDKAGNTTTCTFSIFALDQIAPVLSACPPNITVNNAQPCGEIINHWDIPTATDNCTPDSAIVYFNSHTPPDTFFNGVTTVVILAEDASGNKDTCTFTITINAVPPPGFKNIPDDITISGCPQAVSWSPIPTAEGFCMLDTVYSSHQPGDTFPTGTTIVSYTAEDKNGMVTTATFTVTITENVPPQFNCPTSPIVVSVGGAIISDPSEFLFFADTISNCSGAQLEFALPTAFDNCGIDSLYQSGGLPSGGAFSTGLNSLVFVAVDSSGNVAQCSISIEIQTLGQLNPVANPTLGCLNGTVTLSAQSIPGATYVWTGPGQSYPNTSTIIINDFDPQDEGLYTVFATINGCTTPLDSVVLELASAPNATDDVISVSPGDTIAFNVLQNDLLVPAFDFSITDVTPLSNLTNLGNGNFVFLAGETDASFIYTVCSKSCTTLCDMAIVTIQVRNDEECDFIPNIFTPNNDEVNDYLIIPCIDSGLHRDNSLVVYNQWGDKVFEAAPYSNDPDEAWRGTLDGEPGKDLPDGVYFYIFKPGPTNPVIKGFVEIFR